MEKRTLFLTILSASGIIVVTAVSLFLIIYYTSDPSSSTMEIAQYRYVSPSSDGSTQYTIAIMGTNDIHGAAFPLNVTHSITGEKYSYGGLAYLASIIKQIKSEWQNRFLWLDGGDQFQGAIESTVTNGTIMTDFFNLMELNASAIGNHEFDNGQDFLKSRLQNASFEYLAANMYDNATNKTGVFPNTAAAKLIQVGEVKIGVIGLITIETNFTTSGNLSGLRFDAYKSGVEYYSQQLKEQGANAIVLDSHVGMACNSDGDEKMILKIRNNETVQGQCDSVGEMRVLLESLEPGVVDAVVGGHVHNIAHHYIKNIPVVQNINGGYYTNVLYLTFSLPDKKVITSQIEGPIPVCSKIFSNTSRCDYLNDTQAPFSGNLVNYTFHNKLIVADLQVEELLNKTLPLVAQYKVDLTATNMVLTKQRTKENVLGNLACDILINSTKADIAVLNDGIFRSTWFPGDINIEAVYNMFPFVNEMYTFTMNGTEVNKTFSIIQNGTKSFYHTAGIKQNLTYSPNNLKSISLYNNTEIIADKNYTIATIDFLILSGGDDFRNIITWYKPKDLLAHGNYRTATINYLSTVTKINQTRFIDPLNPRINIVSQ